MINTKTPLHILIHKDQYPRRQLNTLYKAIPITEEQISLLRKYFDAFANLYGIVPLSIAYDIIHKQAPELVTKEQFLAFSEIARHECEEYRILGAEDVFQGVQATPAMDREIVDIALLETDFDEYFHLHEKQFGSPFCIPPQNILLRYSDPFYTEADSAFKKIRKMLRSLLSNTDNSEEMISVLCSEIIFGARYMDADIVEIMERLEYHQVIFTSDDSAMELQSCIPISTLMPGHSGDGAFRYTNSWKKSLSRILIPSPLPLVPSCAMQSPKVMWKHTLIRRSLSQWTCPMRTFGINCLKSSEI